MLTSWRKYRTFWVAFVARRVPQTAPNIGLHHSWRNRRRRNGFIFVKHNASYSCLVAGNLRDAIIFEPCLNRPSWKRNLNRSSATTCRVTSILVYIAMLWRWRHCLIACICARGCSVRRSTVSVTPTSNMTKSFALTEEHLQAILRICNFYAHRHRFWCTEESEVISPVTLNIAINVGVRSVDSIFFNTPCSKHCHSITSIGQIVHYS